MFGRFKENTLPGQLATLHGTFITLSPLHLLIGDSLLVVFVLLFVWVPSPQETEQSSVCHKFHSQLTGVANF